MVWPFSVLDVSGELFCCLLFLFFRNILWCCLNSSQLEAEELAEDVRQLTRPLVRIVLLDLASDLLPLFKNKRKFENFVFFFFWFFDFSLASLVSLVKFSMISDSMPKSSALGGVVSRLRVGSSASTAHFVMQLSLKNSRSSLSVVSLSIERIWQEMGRLVNEGNCWFSLKASSFCWWYLRKTDISLLFIVERFLRIINSL